MPGVVWERKVSNTMPGTLLTMQDYDDWVPVPRNISCFCLIYFIVRTRFSSFTIAGVWDCALDLWWEWCWWHRGILVTAEQLIESQGLTVSHVTLPSSSLWVHKTRGGDTVGMEDPKHLKGYPPPHSSSPYKTGGRRRKREMIRVMAITSEEPLLSWRWLSIACPWEIVDEFFILLCLHMKLVLVNYLYFNTQVFPFTLLIPCTSYWREWARGCVGLSCLPSLSHSHNPCTV